MGAAVKITCSSCRGLKFCPQHPRGASQLLDHNCSSRISKTFFWPPQAHQYTCTCIYVHTHMHVNKSKTNLLMQTQTVLHLDGFFCCSYPHNRTSSRIAYMVPLLLRTYPIHSSSLSFVGGLYYNLFQINSVAVGLLFL